VQHVLGGKLIGRIGYYRHAALGHLPLLKKVHSACAVAAIYQVGAYHMVPQFFESL
jgi:hypothetical protein